jgi:hypothetical protein
MVMVLLLAVPGVGAYRGAFPEAGKGHVVD